MTEEPLINKVELEYLRGQLLAKYDQSDKEKNGNMELNTHKKNYILLAKKLTDLIQDQRKYGNTYTYKSIGTSQLMAFIHDTNQGDPKSFLVEACYQYIYGEKRKYFFQSREGKELLETWKNAPIEPIAAAVETVKNKEIEAENTLIPLENVENVPNLEIREQIATTESKPFWVRYIKAIAAVICVVLGLSLYMTYKFYNKYQLERLWASPLIEDEIMLKKRMTFIDDPAFQNVVLSCLHLIENQYVSLQKGVNKSTVSNELIYYKNDKNSEELSLMGYHFYTGFASWWSPNAVTSSLQDSVHLLFDNVIDSAFIKLKNDGEYNPKERFFIQKLLKTNQLEFQPVSVFIIFKNEKTELVVRYPPFKEDRNKLDKYVLANRQWFKDAYDTDAHTSARNRQLHWELKDNQDQTIQIGLSEPFLSVRTRTPLHRALWFKIPTKNGDAMLFCVSLILNNQ
jgi:hypothetical protein